MDPGIRYFFYDLFFSMFVREPGDEIIDAWRQGLEAVRQAQPDAPLVQAAGPLMDMLDGEAVNEAVRDEFVRLFWLPDRPAVSLLGSHYVDGKPFGEYLVRLRTFLEKTPFRKCDDYVEPEDSLPFHLDLMRSFIREESETTCPQEKAGWRALQRELVNDCMFLWVSQFLEELKKRDTEPFYRQVASLLGLYLQNEQEFMLESRHRRDG